jgi:hypothetical protein
LVGRSAGSIYPVRSTGDRSAFWGTRATVDGRPGLVLQTVANGDGLFDEPG